MSELLNKLSSYNLFNYLLPGVLFAALSGHVTKYSFIQEDIVTGVFVYYFIGLVISRVGSLVIEPLLKWGRFLKFADYKDFVSASKEDQKLEVLSETNNMYRTITSLFLLLFLLKLYERMTNKYSFLNDWNTYILIGVLLIMFLFSYRKQTKYITSRIEARNNQ